MKNKLQNPNTTPNTHWTVLECFFYNKRISRIPPILADDKLNSDFYEKVNVSNNVYASACSSVKSESILSSFSIEQTMLVKDKRPKCELFNVSQYFIHKMC